MEKNDQSLVPCLQAGSRFGKLCFSHDSRYLFCCCGSVIKVFNTSNGECIHDLKAHAKSVNGVFLNPGNVLQLFSCGQDGLLIIWDYLDGIKLKEHDFHMPLHGIISINAEKRSLMMIAEISVYKKKYSLIQWKKPNSDLNNYSNKKVLIEDCCKDYGLVSFGCSKRYVASGNRNILTIYSMKKDQKRMLQDSDKYNKMKSITCVACHPNEYIIAAGLDNGKIILWHNFFGNNEPVISRLHWHALPCLSVAFSPDGSNLLSGGHECVLLKWQMGNSAYKDFKPRMGAPVTQVLCSPDGTLYATGHSDNVIQLLNVNLKVLQVYRGLTRGSFGLGESKNPIPCGLNYDPRSQSLITNGLPGHLQFYSLALNRQLYNLDIVGQNYISPENVDRPTTVTEVTSVCINDKGEWLATFEIWDDGHFTPEHRLKFWSWSSEAQTYSLNTTVECPHDDKVIGMLFRPQLNKLEENPSLVTFGSDCCYKKWSLIDDTDIYRSNSRWDCESVGFYRGLEVGCAAFSSDSTTLAVGFNHLITLWDPDNNIVHATLPHPLPDKKLICHLLFGNKECSHYLVAATSKTLFVWDLLSLTVQWKLETTVTVLIQDPLTDLMAFVTADSSVNVFRPSTSSTVYSHDNVSDSAILSAVFIPHGRHKSITDIGWPGTSQIYVFNEDEELLTFDFLKQLENDNKKIKLAQSLPQSTLKTFMAEKLVREKETDQAKISLNSRIETNEDFVSTLLHSNEPVSAMCEQYLRTLLVKSSNTVQQRVHDSDESSSSDEEMETDESNNFVKGVLPVLKTNETQQREDTEDMDKLLARPLDWIQWCADLKL